ncbi:MAG: transketolase, partial [bacterium]|nr:transketolase [bacterium]
MRWRETDEYALKKGVVKLLEIKDSDLRLMSLEQCRDAVDKGIHIGGAFSATIPLTALFYGGCLDLDIEHPTKSGQDMFVLSKGHAVAVMASIYADLGYFERSVLKNSRSQESILNGHPGPILPGCHISTGPLGQGMGVAQGFAIVGKKSPNFDVFCMTGDGELQEGPIWETAMYAGYKKLDNLCVLVDKNFGQLDDPRQLIFPMTALNEKFTAFGWRVLEVDATQYEPMCEALQRFKFTPRDGRPTVIICESKKGFGGFSDFMVKHKVNLDDTLTDQEMALQKNQREHRVAEFLGSLSALEDEAIRKQLLALAKEMNLDVIPNKDVIPIQVPVKTQRAAARNPKITYDLNLLPDLDSSKQYSAGNVIASAMKVFARDP